MSYTTHYCALYLMYYSAIVYKSLSLYIFAFTDIALISTELHLFKMFYRHFLLRAHITIYVCLHGYHIYHFHLSISLSLTDIEHWFITNRNIFKQFYHPYISVFLIFLTRSQWRCVFLLGVCHLSLVFLHLLQIIALVYHWSQLIITSSNCSTITSLSLFTPRN